MYTLNIMNIHLLAYFIGITILFLSHAYMLVKMPSMRDHSILNLVAASLVAYYFMHREGYIRF
jgi:tRNA C32,U32 (ribose-2'-O)-methylase TrmJ